MDSIFWAVFITIFSRSIRIIMIWPEVEVTPEEAEAIAQGEAEIEAGLGVKAEDVWRELGLSDD